MALLSKLKRVLTWVNITKSGSDAANFPVQQIQYKDKLADTVVIFPYGFHANMTPDTLALMGTVGGDDANKVILGCIPPSRPKLVGGEVVVYHPGTGSKVVMKSNGDIELTAPNVTINASQSTFTGDVAVDGDLTVGPLAKDFITHTHPITGGSSAPGPTGPVT